MATKIETGGGYQAGYDDGNAAGYSNGYSAGNSAGYNSGYSAGNSAGYNSGHSAGYNSGYSDGTKNGRGKLRVTQLYGFSVSNQYSSVIDTGGTGSKTLYIALGTIRENSGQDVYIVAQGSYDGNSWVDISRCNDNCMTDVKTVNYRYFRLYSHRLAGGDISCGEIATLAD